QHLDSAGSRVLPGRISVEQHDRLCRIALQEPHLLLREGGSQGCNAVGDSCLMGGNDIHVPFNEHEKTFCADRGGRLVDAEQVFPLAKESRFRGVQVLLLRITESPPAERDNLPPRIRDGKHDPVGEKSRAAPARAFNEQSRFRKELLRITFLGKKLKKPAPFEGRIAELKPLDRLLLKPPPRKVS